MGRSEFNGAPGLPLPNGGKLRQLAAVVQNRTLAVQGRLYA
jgi:hypothetical protein